MKTSELINKLLEVLHKDGDLDVVINGDAFTTNDLILTYREYYYDGGVLLKNGKLNRDWLKSKNHPELGSMYLHIIANEPLLGECYETIEGFTIPAITEWDSEECYDKLMEIFNRI